MLTRTTFRLLLLSLLLLFVMPFAELMVVAPKMVNEIERVTQEVTQTSNAATVRAAEEYGRRSTNLEFCNEILEVGSDVFGIISWIGLFFFWGFARTLFALHLFFSYFLTPILSALIKLEHQKFPIYATLASKLNVPEPVTTRLTEPLLALFTGVVLAVMFTEAGNRLFKKE